MAGFDPDAFLAKVEEPAPAGGGFDPDAFLAKTEPQAQEPPGFLSRAATVGKRIAGQVSDFGGLLAGGAQQLVNDPIGGIKDLGRGIAQGAAGLVGTVGRAGDTINQVVAHPVATLGDQRFRTELMRGVNDNIPLANSAVEVLGGPPAESPTDAAAFPNARALGNVAGLALPTGKALGAVADSSIPRRAAELLAKRGESRMVEQAVKDIAGSKETGLSKPTDRRQIAKAADAVKDEFREPGAIKIADTARKDPSAAWEMVQKRVDDLTKDRVDAYRQVDDATGGVHVGDLRKHLGDEVRRLGKSPGHSTERQAVEAMIKDVDETWGAQATPLIPTIEMRKYVTRLQRVAADTMGGLEETRRVQLLEHLSGVAKDFLDAHLDDAAKSDPALAGTVADLRTANKRTAAWLSLEDALKTRAGKLETNRMVDTRGKFAAGAMGAGAAGMHFLHSPVAAGVAGAAAAAPYVAPVIDRALTRGVQKLPGMLGSGTVGANPAAVARLLQAARAGASRAELQAQAQQDGVPQEIAANIAQQTGR